MQLLKRDLHCFCKMLTVHHPVLQMTASTRAVQLPVMRTTRGDEGITPTVEDKGKLGKNCARNIGSFLPAAQGSDNYSLHALHAHRCTLAHLCHTLRYCSC